MRRQPLLSWRRPLPWRWRLTLCVLGLLAGAEGTLAFGSAARTVTLVGVLLSPLLLLGHRRVGTACALVSAFALLGHLRADATALSDPAEVRVSRRSIVVEGVIRALRWRSGRGGVRSVGVELELRRVAAPDGPVVGDVVRLSIGRVDRAWELGDRVELRVKVRPARGFCNGGRDRWARWLARSGIRWTAWARDDAGLARVVEPSSLSLEEHVVLLRGRIARVIDGSVGEPAAGVLRALVIGDKGRLGNDLREAFARTGTAHLLAVSGMHLALVAGAAFGLTAALLSRAASSRTAAPLSRVAGPASLVAAAGYVVLTGGAVATRRALVMVGFVVVALVLRRRASGRSALLLAVLLLVGADPEVVRDLSFQLSVVSVAALLAVANRVEGWRWMRRAGPGDGWGRRIGLGVAAGVVASVAAGGTTAPLSAHYFGLVSVGGPLANVFVAPLLGVAALSLGLLGASLSPWLPALARVVFGAAGAAVDLSIGVVQLVAGWSWSAVAVPSPGVAQVCAGVLFAGGLLVVGRGPRRLAWAAALVCLLLPLVSLRAPALRLSVLDVGQGDAILLEGPEGSAWLIDGGGLGGDFDTGEGVVLPALAARPGARLQAVVMSHADRDHYGGLGAVVRGSAPEQFWWNGRDSKARGFRALRSALEETGTTLVPLDAEDGLDGKAGLLEMRVLHPPPTAEVLSRNDASLVLGVRYGATRVLLAGDVEARGERFLWRNRRLLPSTIAKVPHHGSRSSSTQRFVSAVRPSLALASLGTFNRFGFPASEVVERYHATGSTWRGTGTWGEIQVVSDGQVERVETCRTR